MIFVLFSHSGSGKSTILRELQKDPNVDVNIKATSRLSRGQEDDVICVSREKLLNNNNYLVYSQGYTLKNGEIIYYGINRTQIDNSLTRDRSHWLICGKIEIIRELKHIYLGKVIVIYMSFDAPIEVIQNILLSRRNTEKEDYSKRINSIVQRKTDYENNIELFDYHIINHYKTNKASIDREIKRLVEECKAIMRISEGGY